MTKQTRMEAKAIKLMQPDSVIFLSSFHSISNYRENFFFTLVSIQLNVSHQTIQNSSIGRNIHRVMN